MHTKILLFSLFIFNFSTTYSQDFIGLDKASTISELKEFGFAKSPDSKLLWVDSSGFVIGLFDEYHCSRIEYHFSELDQCDSIFSTSSCTECFLTTLNSVLDNRSRKWIKIDETKYVSLSNPGKFKSFSKPKMTEYSILKLKILEGSTQENSAFIMFRELISESEFKRLKKSF